MAICTSLIRPTQPRPTSDRFSWDRPDFGGHIFEASYVDAEPAERDA